MSTREYDIRRAVPADLESLVEIWLASVRASHSFLTETDIQALLPHVREGLGSGALELWVLTSTADAVAGFMGMCGSKIEALFLAPEQFRRGGGRRLVAHAQTLHAELTVDVNEENPTAIRFYEACGFVVVGRSNVDGAGRPFPLVHMHRAEPSDASTRT